MKNFESNNLQETQSTDKSYLDYFAFKNKIDSELLYFNRQYREWIIDSEKFDEIETKLQDLLNNYTDEKENIDKKYESLKNEILTETWIQLSQNKEVASFQIQMYDNFWIDKLTYKNSTKNRFIKWILDSFLTDNYEIIQQLKEKWIWFLEEIIKSILSIEWLKQIAKAFWETIWNVFDWDAYERWKSLADLWLIWTWWLALYKWWKAIIKWSLKRWVKSWEKSLGKEIVDTWKNTILNHELVSAKNVDQVLEKLKNAEKLDSLETQLIDTKIINNNPALWIFDKLKNKDRFQSIIFTWVKKVNDSFSQAFCDNILNNFKNEVLKNYPWVIPVWNDYKNFVLKIEKNAKVPSQKELENLLESIYNKEVSKLSVEEMAEVSKKLKDGEILPKLWAISEEWIVKWKSQSDIMLSLAEKRSTLETKALWNIVLSTEKLVDKLGEIWEKYNLKSGFSEVASDARWRTLYTTKNWVLIKEFTIKETWKKVVNRMLILDANWNINPSIINLVRKGKIPNNLEIFKDVNQIIKSSIANWEFIWPFIRKTWLKNWDLISKEVLENYKLIKDKLIKWEKLSDSEISILRELSEKTFKNAFDKDIFYHKINKSWELFFIDIAWMWNINIQDFINKIKLFNDWKIGKKELLLNSWSYMTDSFQKLLVWLQNDLAKIYPWKNINFYVWWDEIWIFIEWVKLSNDEVVKIINKNLDKNLLEWRTTKKLIKENDLQIWWKKLFEEIDKLTSYSKTIEARIDETIEQLKVAIKEKYIPNSAEMFWKLEVLKKFDISKIDWELYITFHPPNWFELFWKINKFKLEDIIDLNTLKLKPKPDSPFINYLIKHNLER